MEILNKHTQIANKLRDELWKGQYPFGERLPTTKVLAHKFNVSNNVIIKAVHQLRNEGLIEIKRGAGGMYSLAKHRNMVEASGKSPATLKPMTGSKIFQIGKPKTIRIQFEDHTPFQIKFWKDLIQIFRTEHPDINPILHFGQESSKQNSDLTIGGLNYLGRFIIPSSPLNKKKEMLLWEPPDYSMSILEPHVLTASRFPELLPIMFQQSVILCNNAENIPEDATDVLDFVQKFKETSKKPVKYRIWSFARLMSNCGINVFDWIANKQELTEDARIMATLKRLRNFYKAEDVMWFHGNMSDIETIIKDSFNSGVRFLEINSAVFGGIKLDAKIKKIHYPFSHYSDPIPICALIAPDTPYPVEAIDFVRYLLSDSVQEKILKSQIGLSLNRNILQKHGYENMISRLQHAKIINTSAVSPELTEIYRLLFSWEMYHYLNGKRGEDVLVRLRAKIKHYQMVTNKKQNCIRETPVAVIDSFRSDPSPQISILQASCLH